MSNVQQNAAEIQASQNADAAPKNGLYVIQVGSYDGVVDAFNSGAAHKVSGPTDLNTDCGASASVLVDMMLMLHESINAMGNKGDWDVFWFEDGKEYDVSAVQEVFCAE